MSIDTPPRTIRSRPESKEEEIRLSIYAEIRTAGTDVTGFLDIFAYAVNNRIWEKLRDKNDRPLTFRQFIEAPYPVGVGSSVREIAKIAKLESRNEAHPETAEALAAMRRAVDDLVNEPEPTAGGDRRSREFQSNNITLNHTDDRGTSREYTLRRLKRDNPELAEMVISGELSANAAAIEAGFRKRATPLDQLRKAWGKASAGERAAFLEEIGE